ncbi:MAG: hypothetical protein KIS94_00860 [Chitinophagales bacterium]|nr:hypothetical protein [Chitinophagales bacterium]
MNKTGFYLLSFGAWVIVTFLLIEILFRVFVFTPGSSFQLTYQSITNPKTVLPYSSAPYLNYINTPNLRDKDGNFEVNSMGIRYPTEIDLKKNDSTLRILFMGGSTTFGEIDDTFDVFPALVEKKIKQEYLPNQKRFNNVECLNAGVHGLTSAELLTHYQFKYQYLQPHLIVLHTGINDAFAYAKINGSEYQPDYHNSRRVFYDVRLPNRFERMLLVSKAFAYALIRIRLTDFLNNSLEKNIFFYYNNDKPWFTPGNSAISDTAYNAFYNNLHTLISVAKSRNTPILIVPEVIDTTDMPSELAHILTEGLQLNVSMLYKLAEKHPTVTVDTLPKSEFTPDTYNKTDGIHASYKGEQLKAFYLHQFITQKLNSIFNDSKN